MSSPAGSSSGGCRLQQASGGIDEARPYPARQKYLYSETKAEAERRVLAGNGAAMATISIRPRFVWGPRDTSVLPAVLRMAKEGSFAWIDGGAHRTSTTHVANLVHARMIERIWRLFRIKKAPPMTPGIVRVAGAVMAAA